MQKISILPRENTYFLHIFGEPKMHIFVKTGVKEICIFLVRPICRKYTENMHFS